MIGESSFIGEVAREAGLSVHTIRFYETKRLLPEAPRTESGYRVYSPQDVVSLKFIKRAQGLGFSLNAIRELLVLRDQDTSACSHVKVLLEDKLRSVRAKMRELRALEKEIRRALRECVRQLGHRHPAPGKQCPVLVKLGRAT